MVVTFLFLTFPIQVLASDSSVNALPERISSLARELAVNPDQPSLWKQLGKIQLDDGEFAEARRIFCHGATCCPNDLELDHHRRVFDTFHGEDNKEYLEEENESTNTIPLDNPNLIYSVDVSPSQIPNSILKHPTTSNFMPEQRTKLIHATTEPILAKIDCANIIEAASATTKLKGWTKDRHVQAPTCDIPVFELEVPMQQWIRSCFHQKLFPLICKAFENQLDIDPAQLRIQDCFVVRYDAAESNGPGFSQLKPHHDESLISLTIALNDMDVDYQDGGLFMAATGDVLNGPAGTVMCFAGGLLHGGYPISSGTRWILTVFCYVDSNQSKKSPGYTLEAIDRLSKENKR